MNLPLPAPEDYRKLADTLLAAGSVAVTTHVRPDADALGTTAAVAEALASRGKRVECLLLSDVPARYAFIYEETGVPWRRVPEGDADPLAGFDALLVCDTGTYSQLPGLEAAIKRFDGPKLVLDHHKTQEEWATQKVVDVSAGAAAEVAMELLDAMGKQLTPRVARALYAALATDTGWFAFSNTTSRTMQRAAECLDAGADPDTLNRRIRQQDPPSRLRLWATGLASLEYHAGGKVATMTLSADDHAAAGATVEEAEDLVNEPLRVAVVEVSVILGQDPKLPPDRRPVKVSVRTKGKVDAAALCNRFGGGGHARAAGCRVDGQLAQVRERILAAVVEQMPD